MRLLAKNEQFYIMGRSLQYIISINIIEVNHVVKPKNIKISNFIFQNNFEKD